jgi:hypothetical protein
VIQWSNRTSMPFTALRDDNKLTIRAGRMEPLSRLGGSVASVVATGPKGRGFKPGRLDGFLREIQIRSTLSFG